MLTTTRRQPVSLLGLQPRNFPPADSANRAPEYHVALQLPFLERERERGSLLRESRLISPSSLSSLSGSSTIHLPRVPLSPPFFHLFFAGVVENNDRRSGIHERLKKKVRKARLVTREGICFNLLSFLRSV